MKALLIGNRERFQKYDPHTAFSDAVEKIYVTMETAQQDIPSHALDADFIAADAIAEVPGSLIRKMPKLKLIHSEGVGYDRIDLAAAKEAGVSVCNNRGVNACAVAEQAILLMLGLLRDVTGGDRAVRQGEQFATKERMMLQGIRELGDCAVGLIGFGDIAKATATRLQVFGADVYYFSRSRKSNAEEETYRSTWMELPELLRTCDIISIHVPVTPETAGMVDDSFLRSMRRDAFLINTARGDIVDNAALCRALEEGWIAGAGLDTIAPEPVPKDHPLLNLSEQASGKLLLSPHIGGITEGVFFRAHRNLWRTFETVAGGGMPGNLII